MQKWEIGVDKYEIEEIMKLHDIDWDNEIDFDDFVAIFVKDPKELKKIKSSPI